MDTLKGILDIQKGRDPGLLDKLKGRFWAQAYAERRGDIQKDTRHFSFPEVVQALGLTRDKRPASLISAAQA